jgi:hypothetical protein
MKRLPIILALLCLLIITISFGSAQGNESQSEPVTEPTITEPQNENITDLDLFTWANTDPPNWTLGLLYAFLGFMGALVAIFALIGSAVPGTAGAAIIEADTIRLKNNSDRLDTLIQSEKCDSECIKALGTVVNDLRDDINAEKWHQFKYAVPIYLILGAFFATMLALTLLQAILIGFGWTGVIGALGLKNDYEYRKSLKDTEMDTLKKKVEDLKGKVPKEQQEQVKATPTPQETIQEMNFQIARKL